MDHKLDSRKKVARTNNILADHKSDSRKKVAGTNNILAFIM